MTGSDVSLVEQTHANWARYYGAKVDEAVATSRAAFLCPWMPEGEREANILSADRCASVYRDLARRHDLLALRESAVRADARVFKAAAAIPGLLPLAATPSNPDAEGRTGTKYDAECIGCYGHKDANGSVFCGRCDASRADEAKP